MLIEIIIFFAFKQSIIQYALKDNEHAHYGFENLIYRKKKKEEGQNEGRIITIGIPYENIDTDKDETKEDETKEDEEQEAEKEEDEDKNYEKGTTYEINEDLLEYFESKDFECLDESDAEECRNQVGN